MAWFRKTKKQKVAPSKEQRSAVPEGLWVKCDGCREIIYAKELERNLRICPKCGYHFRIGARERWALLLDADGAEELFSSVRSADPLQFKDQKAYKQRLKDYGKSSGEDEAVIVVAGSIEETPVVVAVMEYRFMGGSMGSAVGEKITRAAEEALRRQCRFDCRFSVGRGQDAGGHSVADADGQDLRRAGAAVRTPGSRTFRSSPIRPPAV